MKKYYSIFLLFLFLQLNAQIKDDHCGTDALHLKSVKENPEYKRRFEKSTEDWKKYAPEHQDNWKPLTKTGPSAAMPPTVITLNVVFHDLSSTTDFLLPGTASVTDYQYILDRLNLIYNGTNLGGRPAGNNTFIDFCLARKSQNGNTYTFASTQHPGIQNASSLDRTDTGQLDALVTASTAINAYNTTNYINVYIVDDILGTVAGFASLPPAHGTTRDGIFIERQWLRNNPALVNNMNVLAHEMGHYLGLLHTFGLCDTITTGPGYDCSCDNNNCLFNGDMICDTPPNMLQQTGYSSPSNFPNTCSTDAIPYSPNGTNLNPITANVQDPKDNYMDYGIWSLQNRFTQGQVMRMQFMVDPDVGPRKSLLGQAACANCTPLHNCAFTMTQNPAFTDARHIITQIGTNTPSVQFSLTGPCITTLGGSASYSWTLQNLDTSVITSGSGSSYTTTPGLAVGNYSITLTITLNSNSLCSESVTYNFTVFPQLVGCNLATPATNSAGNWTAANWLRTSFADGWYLSGGNYPVGSQHFDNTQPGFNDTGFDVVAIAPGGSISAVSDPILGGVVLPATANINNVMRVGLRTGGGATAFYAKRTITVNRNNCRFRVWVLGATQGSSTNTKYPFHGASSSSNDAAFGVLSRYRYNSPVSTITNTYNVTVGHDDLAPNSAGTYHNVIVSQMGILPVSDFPAGANLNGFHRMTAWKSYILDYSEYVDLNPETEITLTFFSHSNVDANALQNAYAYYGIECLGGGIPQSYNFELPDKSISCSSPGTQSCAEFNIPSTIYAGSSGYGYHNYQSHLFDDVKVYKLDANGVPSTTPYPISFVTNNTLKICLDQQDAPFQDFRIVCKTFHTTVTDDFRVYIGFYNNIADCTTGDVIDANIHPNLINGDILLCGVNNLPTLNFTPTCITAPFTYQWCRQSNTNPNIFDPIPGANSAQLPLAYNSAINWTTANLSTTNNYNPYICNTYIRKVNYIEPYCSNPKTKISEQFHIYNSWAIILKFNNANDNDICFGDTYTLNVVTPMLSGNTLQYSYGCSLPSHFNADLAATTNHLSFQLFDPATNQPFGNIINYIFNGPFVESGLLSSINLAFSFNNINPTTGTPLFTPTATTTSFPIDIMISGDYLGCNIEGINHKTHIQDINFSQSAVGGHIAFNCSTNSGIVSTDDGVSYGGYGWEYSIDNINFTAIPGAPSSSTLPGSVISTLSSFNPLYIRRRSNGTGECLDPQYSNVVLLTNHPPTIVFNNFPSPICRGGAVPVLSNTSSNGILGTWDFVTVNNQASGTYTFTPLEGYCLPPYVYNLTVLNGTLPTFTQLGPFCAGTIFTLPSTSNNGVAGTWSIMPIDLYHTKTYTFTPTSVNACSTPVTMTVVINPVSTVSFANSNYLFVPICYGAAAPVLPTTDDNGVVGVWNQPVSNTATGTYTFTPTNLCIPPASFTIGVLQTCGGFTLSWGSEVSCEYADPRVKYDLNIEDGPCLKVCANSLIHYELHGNLSMIDHTDWQITGGTEGPHTNTSCDVTWSNATYCALQGVIHLTNGTQLIINKCIEKLETPHASFAVFPGNPGESYSTCINTPTYFENYSFANNGDDNLYYNWYFSDGTTSNEFEPVHTFTSPGTYTVTLVVSNGCSCVARVEGEIYVSEGQIKIECPSVVCEGNVSQYSIAADYGNCEGIIWDVEGGTIVSQQNNNTSVQIIWNNIDDDGFGYITVSAPSCSSCSSKVKIPVVKQLGTIKGDLEVCEKTQNLYSLPQWPTTNFNWSIDAHGTGATLIPNTQRNEIILNSSASGIVDLYCTYNNTLLNCGGTAHIAIKVNATFVIAGESSLCQGATSNYEIQDSFGNPISNPSWTVTGPQSYQVNGSQNPFSMTFPAAGIYNITASDPNHCSLNPLTITVKAVPTQPTSITGPMLVCPGIPVTYSCTPPAGTIAHWSVNSLSGTILGSSIGNSILVNFIPTATAAFTVSLQYENDGCYSNTFSVTPLRDTPNLAVIDSDTLVCGSSYGDYAVNNSNADSYTWSIDPPTAGSIETGQNSPSVHILWNQLAQTAFVKLIINKCGKPYNIVPINVTIINAPAITITGSANLCSLQNATFNFTQNPTGTFGSVLWNFGDGDTFTSTSSTSATHQYQTPTDGSVNYTVTATVSGGNGCLMNAISNFNVIVSPSPVVAISPVNNLNLCDLNNSPGSYTYSVTMQGGFASTDIIQWFRNGAIVQSGFGPSASTINVQSFGIGTYYASVTNSFTCTSNTASFQVYSSCGGCSAPEVIDIAVDNNGCQGVIAHATLLPAGYTSAYWSVNLPGATVVSSLPSNFEAINVAPGEYPIRLYASYTHNNQSCTTSKERSFTIPYKANLKYEVSCGVGNTYQVKLLDFSTYYANTPPTQFWFTVDNGLNWYPGNSVSGIYQYLTNLSPGNYQIGIRIKCANYDACEKIISLSLPNLPTGNFTNTNNICVGTPVQFTVTNPQPGQQYLWNFGDGSTNLQPNPSKTFTTSGIKQVTLTVTNEYGCAVTSAPHFVTIIGSNMAGNLTVAPTTVCQGGTMNINFNSTGTPAPVHYTWYQNTVANVPFSTTASPNLPVTQNGQYLVYLKDANGCQLFTIRAASIAFTPLPQTPVITGNTIACVDGAITLKVAANPGVIYEWKRDGIVQPQWNNQNIISDSQSNPGVHTYSVIAKVLAGGTTYCSSAPGSISVEVVALPDMPVLSISSVSCDPYQVTIDITNPQAGAGYYWSNGALGTSVVLNHDGPLQVRAVINECFVKTQLDLPTDLQPLSWIFPKGCYDTCGDKPLGTIIGPLGEYEHWDWIANEAHLYSGSGGVPPLVDLSVNTNYSLNLDNGYCNLLTGSMSIAPVECAECHYKVDVKKVSCIRVDGQNMYQVILAIDNPYGATTWGTFSVPNGEGFFTPVTVTLPPGVTNHTLSFTSNNGFMGGTVSVLLNSVDQDNKSCIQKLEIKFPEDCETITECRFTNRLKATNCFTIREGLIIYVAVEISNPYPVSATTQVSIPASIGTITPDSFTTPSGTAIRVFYIHTSGGFNGGVIPITITHSIGSLSCTSVVEAEIRRSCPDVRACEFSFERILINCQRMPNGQYGYVITATVYNPYGTPATITLSPPNNMGAFVPNVLNLPPGASQQTFALYPENFGGGNMSIDVEGHYKDEICLSRITLRFPRLCCPTCRPDLEDPAIKAENLLVLSPNPVENISTIYFNFANNTGSKTITLTDMLGRTLQEWQPNESKGTITVNCDRYAQGHYVIIMKQDGKLIETTRMIKN
jgi:PKD repeat protein